MFAALATVVIPLGMLAGPIGVVSLFAKRDFSWARAYLERLGRSQKLGHMLTPFDLTFASINKLARVMDKAVLRPMLVQAHRMMNLEMAA